MSSKKVNVIAIHADSINTNIKEFVKKQMYAAVPFVTYKINGRPVEECMINRPLVIFGEDKPYGELYKTLHDDRSLIHMPSKDFERLKKHSSQCLNRVIADLVTSIVVKTVSSSIDNNTSNLFFIEGVESNKTVGRLGYLYLDSIKNTLAFLSYKPQALLTDILNTNSNNLHFDLYYFMRNSDNISRVIPNDFRESLTQFVLFDTTVTDSEKKVLPVRCDIMSQGIASNEIRNKVEIIKNYLSESNNMTPPFQETADGEWIRIPRTIQDCINFGNSQTKMRAKMLLEGLYE